VGCAQPTHSVCKGDEYALYPHNLSEDVSYSVRQALVKAKVNAVRGLSSDLVGFDQASAIDHVKTGWKARPLTHLYPHRIPVRLMDDVGNRDPWIAVIEQSCFLCLNTEGVNEQSYLFCITRNKHSEF
jgi:hypothetical protein